MSKRARLFVVSGPSGVGKGTLVAAVRQALPDLGLTVSATTRAPRPGEAHGREYYFMSDSEFDEHIKNHSFLEWAQVHDHRYATLYAEVDRCLSEGRSVILEIDVQGALMVRKQRQDAVLIFIEPPSWDVLERRLTERGTEDAQTIQLRMKNACHELELASRYDHRIVNDDLKVATKELLDCICSSEMEAEGDKPEV